MILSKISQIIVLFIKTRQNLMQGFEVILEIGRNSAVLLFSKENSESFLKKFQNYSVFRPKRENWTQGFLIFLKSRLK